MKGEYSLDKFHLSLTLDISLKPKNTVFQSLYHNNKSIFKTMGFFAKVFMVEGYIYIRLD